MSCDINTAIMEDLYNKYLDLGYGEKLAAVMAKLEFEEKCQ